jgi:carboxyl-terminal processing protease
MNDRLVRVRNWFAFLMAFAGMILVNARVSAEPTLTKEDPAVARMVCEFLKRGHLNKPEINDEVSKRLFAKFVKGLDPTKSYFLKSDIDEFKKHETDLDDQLLGGDLSFPYAVYERFVKRVGERQKLVGELVADKHDFTVNESLDTNYDKMDYPKNDDEVRERWRKRVKFDLLMERVAEKPVPEDEAKKKIITRYNSLLKRWKQVDHADLLEIYLTDLTTSIDPHSTYMSPNTLDDFAIAMRLNLDGIGAVLRSENGQTTIVEVVPGGAAGKDGRLKPNDKIVGVAQGDEKFVDAVDMKLQEVVKMIRGARGTKVQLKVIPVGKIDPVVIELTRQKIELKSQEARGDIIEDGKKADGKPYKIGVIDLPSFYADTEGKKEDRKSATEDVRRILKEFNSKNVDAVVLDLRRNGGGLLTEAQALTGLFIDQGTIVQVKGSSGKVQQKVDPEKGTDYDGPLVVLVSRFSASASEILAGALQDYGRALIVGDSSTFGKGTVQTVIDLGGQIPGENPPKLGALKLTIQQFYRPNGDSTQARGVTSDVVLPSLTEHLGVSEKESENALEFSKVDPVKHDELDMVPAKLKAALKERSATRVKDSADFAKLAKEIDLFKARKDRKSVPLNEKELKDQLAKDDANKIDDKIKELSPPETSGGAADYKFKRTFINDEVLKIAEDLSQGKKLVVAGGK